jgi:hypothetical protein
LDPLGILARVLLGVVANQDRLPERDIVGNGRNRGARAFRLL